MPVYDEETRARRGLAAIHTGPPAPTLEDYDFDAWTPIAFKRALDGRGAGIHGWSAPDWVGTHNRRLQAYRILAAYRDNAARLFLQEANTSKLLEHREYGDGALIVNTVLAALLGDKQEVAIEGADDEAVDGEVDPAAKKLQDWLQEWADDERLTRKMLETERDAVSLGDGVYTLGWNAKKGRVRLRCWDPGFYFPVLNDDDEFPRKVHLAWEIPGNNANEKKIRRLTWELVEVEPYQLPWSDEPVTDRCLYTDATWTMGITKAATVDDLTLAKAEFATVIVDGVETPINRLDLGIDFLPVVHMPNTVAEKEHYGRSTLATVLQILDDIANADTDLQRAAGTTGTPPVTLSGTSVSGTEVGYKPGQVWNLGAEGKMDVLDTSKSLDALLKLLDSLLKRLHINSRVPEAVVGRVNASDVPSGVALALSFGPLEAMVKEMRLTREEKYPLLLKFVQRLHWVNDPAGAPATWNFEARVDMGSYLPADQASAVQMVTELMTAKAISRETAVIILIQAGFPIADAAKEVERIQHADFDGAVKLLDALGNEEEVAKYLDRKVAPAPKVPNIVPPNGGPVPPAPGGPQPPQPPQPPAQPAPPQPAR